DRWLLLLKRLLLDRFLGASAGRDGRRREGQEDDLRGRFRDRRHIPELGAEQGRERRQVQRERERGDQRSPPPPLEFVLSQDGEHGLCLPALIGGQAKAKSSFDPQAARVVGGSGTVKKKVVPAPDWLSSQMRPPICSTASRAIASPRPVPAAISGW